MPVVGPPLSDGVVTINQDRIAEVTPWSMFKGATQDLGDVALFPGLVNAHTHLEFSDLQQPLGDAEMSLPEWIRLVISNRKRSTRDPLRAIQAGLQEGLRSGVTTLGEIATSPMEYYRSNFSPSVVSFQEVIGFSAARIDSVLADLRKRLSGQTESITLGVSPHAPYTVHPRLLVKLVLLSVEYRYPVAMHLAESTEELELLANKAGPFRDLLEERSMWDEAAIPMGSRPLDYLQVLARAPRALVIHGNYLTSEEINYLGEKRDTMAVVYCPRTHAYFGHPRYPLHEMLAAGVSVAIGTDSRASNPTLSLRDELKFVANTYPEISPEQILELGTLSGAKALGREGEVGSIQRGKFANLLAISLDGKDDPVEALLVSDNESVQVWLNGKSVL